MGSVTSKLIIGLVDNVSGPAGQAAGSLKNLGRAGSSLSQLARNSREIASLTTQLKSLQERAAKIDNFRQASRALDTTGLTYRKAQQDVRRLSTELAAAEKPTRAQQSALRRAQREAARAGDAFKAQGVKVRSLRAELERANIPVNNLANIEARLKARLDATTVAIRRQARALGTMSGAAAASTKAAASQPKAAPSKVGTAAAAAGVGLAGGARVLAPIGGAYGLARLGAQSVTTFADLDRRMTRIGLTADATTDEVKAATRAMKALALESGMRLDPVAAGLEALVAQGRSLPEAMSFLPAVVKTAQAAGAEVDDIAKSADAVATHFKIGAGEMQGAFDTMVTGGKIGQFELKDMARYLPSLAAAAKAVGIQGNRGLADLVAMLQVLRKGSGNAEEAATSMQNILQKMDSDETRKRFLKQGVDLEAVLKKGRKEGKNLLQVFEDATWKAIKGDLSQIPRVINDMEFARGMRAILALRGSWQKMADEIRRSAPGSTLRDFEKVANDSRSQIDRMGQSWDNFLESLGKTVAPAVIPALESVTQALDAIDRGESWFQRINAYFAAKEAELTKLRGGKPAEFVDTEFKGAVPGFVDTLFGPTRADAEQAGREAAVKARLEEEEKVFARVRDLRVRLNKMEAMRVPVDTREALERELKREEDRALEIRRQRFERLRINDPGKATGITPDMVEGQRRSIFPMQAGLIGEDPAQPAADLPATAPLPPQRPAGPRMLQDLDDVLGNAADKAQQTGEAMKQSLEITARPTIDTASLDAFIDKGRQALGILHQLGAESRTLASLDVGNNHGQRSTGRVRTLLDASHANG